MTEFQRTDLPADIAVFAGEFASQPLVFAHLLNAAPALDLGHVEVIQSNRPARLSVYFEAETVGHVSDLIEGFNTAVLVLPAAYEALDCPLQETRHLVRIGEFRGTVPHLRAVT